MQKDILLTLEHYDQLIVHSDDDAGDVDDDVYWTMVVSIFWVEYIFAIN